MKTKSRKRILFVGNGVNRLSKGGPSWSKLIDKLAGPPLTNHDVEVRKKKPFTLFFEELSNYNPSGDLKKLVATTFSSEMKSNAFHEQLMNLGFKDILTTNYDHCLEQATKKQWHLNPTANEKYYSLFRCRSLNGNNIWHIHGDIINPSSIMLGHTQYSGYIHKIRNYLTSGVPSDSKKRNRRPYISKFAKSNKRKQHDTTSWVDIFLEGDVDIVGFGFDYTENHLWNLLSEKKKLMNSREVEGKVTFHHCADELQSVEDEAKFSILESLGVSILDHTASTFDLSYEACINSLKR